MANGNGYEFGEMDQKQHQEIYNRDDQPADQIRNGEQPVRSLEIRRADSQPLPRNGEHQGHRQR